MENITTEHEVKGEFKFIREITHTSATFNDVTYGPQIHRGPQCVPGTLEGETYVKHDLTGLSADVKALATHFWTPEVHIAFEAHLVAQAAENNS